MSMTDNSTLTRMHHALFAAEGKIPRDAAQLVLAAIFSGCTDDEVRNTYLAGEGEAGDPIGDLLAAELERRGVHV